MIVTGTMILLTAEWRDAITIIAIPKTTQRIALLIAHALGELHRDALLGTRFLRGFVSEWCFGVKLIARFFCPPVRVAYIVCQGKVIIKIQKIVAILKTIILQVKTSDYYRRPGI